MIEGSGFSGMLLTAHGRQGDDILIGSNLCPDERSGPIRVAAVHPTQPNSKHVHISVKGVKGDASTPGYDTTSP